MAPFFRPVMALSMMVCCIPCQISNDRCKSLSTLCTLDW